MKSDSCCDKGHFDSVLLVLLLPEIKSEKRESSLFFFFHAEAKSIVSN